MNYGGHVLVVTFPVQGHINPGMQLTKRLVRLGVHVTLATSVYQYRRIFSKKSVDGFSVAAFSDGFDDGFDGNEMEPQHYLSEMRRCGSKSLTNLMASNAKEGRPFTYLVYTILLPWAAEVARGFHIPAALLWIQPASVLDIFYYYFHDHGDYIRNKIKQNESSCDLELPSLPSLTVRDLPTFLSDSNMYNYLVFFEEQLQALETNPRVLVNTFEALEPEALRAIDRLNMIAIGPLVPPALSDGKDPSDTSFGVDLFDSSNNYEEWLDSKPESSVIYVAFGSILVLSRKQMEEIGRALLDSGRPFLWVIREHDKKGEEEEEKLRCAEELEEKGKIVKWCSQVEVLTHSSLGCFVTHCGWNSCLESLVCGVPVVAFPQWVDQNTNAKLIQDVWKTGVRVEVDKGEGIVKSEEIRRCLDAVMGNGEMRSNAEKWKELAREAVREGGSSDRNLKAFMDEVEKNCC